MAESIIQIQHFIMATRDSGYRNTASALAELVDNAIQAKATKINIQFLNINNVTADESEVIVIDNGHGMSLQELGMALQFGGSSRFNYRDGLGRYGMGLPNSSLSQCRRVEVTTWKRWGEFIFNYLDVDEVVEQQWQALPAIKQIQQAPEVKQTATGTIVHWKKCDRLSYKQLKSLTKQIHIELGRIFRYAIWSGVEIKVNKEIVEAVDPLFLGKGKTIMGGQNYGDELHYHVRYINDTEKTSLVKVRFIELPVDIWSVWTNEEKKKNFIIKHAGVSVLRAGREIDYGWFFMGDKRKENYDDWWRCEISFEPELDEFFGVTHTKQQIRQTEMMNNILIKDLEQTARVLNNRVRLKFLEIKNERPVLVTKNLLERNDRYLPAIKTNYTHKLSLAQLKLPQGPVYEMSVRDLEAEYFFQVATIDGKITLILNKTHPFYTNIFKNILERKNADRNEAKRTLELLLIAAARAELSFRKSEEKQLIAKYRTHWSNNLKTLMS